MEWVDRASIRRGLEPQLPTRDETEIIMSHLLQPNQSVHTLSGEPCTVQQFLGGGGQGEVYRADLEGRQVALKWYFSGTATNQQKSALETLIQKGTPDARFLWPEDMASDSGTPGFGYIMRLRKPHFKGIVDMMKGRADPSFRALARAGRELADSYLQLHANGLSYCDISFGNVFFDPKTGEVLICDNDNVIVDGKRPAIYGTPRFMAPEIVRSEAMPSTQTDLYSLSVLLFFMFMVHHPLDGAKEAAIKCLDMPAMNKLYGTEPIFIFDPTDASNRPDPKYHQNAIVYWPIYPQFLKDLFIRAFTDGIRDPQNGRVRESEWRSALVRLGDAIIHCAHCSRENFAQDTVPGETPNSCWHCHRLLQRPPSILFGRNRVMLSHDAKLFSHHTDGNRPFDFSQATAELSQNPNDPSQWGLKNLTHQKWVVTVPDGGIRDVEPGRSVRLTPGSRIQFGSVEGLIQA
jgi:DNA-binding helix-hairpin-helix protein with protein kinase domain